MAQAAFPHSFTDVRDLRRPMPIPPARRGRRTLADDVDFLARYHDGGDPDLEAGAWPEMIDQTTQLTLIDGLFWHEDAELDDDDSGIDDEPQDALSEDGI